MAGYGGAEGAMFQLGQVPVHPQLLEQVSVTKFDNHEEMLWVGSERGGLHSFLCPTMERYTSITAHDGCIQGMASTPSGILTVSARSLRLHAPGGLPLFSHEPDKAEADMLCCDLDIQSSRVTVGRKDSSFSVHDISTAGPVSKFPLPDIPMVIRHQAGRGFLAAGCMNGSVVLCDPRNNYRVERSMVPHSCGLVTFDVKGDLLATCGLQTRMGQIALDSVVQVYDIRGAPRVVSHIPFGAGPTMLEFHPKFTSMLVIGSASGVFTISDIQGTGITASYQVQCEGDMVTSCSVSSSGEMVAFGTAGSCLHLWSSTDTPCTNHFSRPTELPSNPLQRLEPAEDEGIDISKYAKPFVFDQPLLSDFDLHETISIGMPPRIVDPRLLQDLKQVDFVGYIPNPKFSRARKAGESTWLAAPLRNQRMPMELSQPDEQLKGAPGRRPASAQLPACYHKMEIRQLQSHVRFEEFDFSFYNRTKFAGLENNMANCYCNPLMQVLFFIPMMRAYLLQHVPDADREFSLTCEAAFLFRMLVTAPRFGTGATCQATNLLRSLRQSREASMLGLLETHKNEPRVKTNKGDIEVETHKERSLSKRLQSLSRFLMEHLHREVSNKSATSPVSDVFGIDYRQRMQCLNGEKAELLREGRSFQVELHYPPVPQHLDPAAGEARDRPSFASVLASSLRWQAEMRAWFDEKRGYQAVRQTRVPLRLPEVMAINCAMRNKEDLAFWLPTSGPDGEKRPWLSWAVEVETRPESFETDVRDVPLEELGQRADEGSLETMGEDGRSCTKAVYALMAMIVHVQEENAKGKDKKEEDEGHVVAHIKVLAHDTDLEFGIAAPAIAQRTRGIAGSGSGSGRAASQTAADSPSQISADNPEPVAAAAAAAAAAAEDATASSAVATSDTDGPGETERPGAGDRAAATAAHNAELETPGGKPHVTRRAAAAHGDDPMGWQGWEGYAAWDRGWMTHNDFCVVPCDGHEVMRLYGTLKVPCLLYYMRVGKVREYEVRSEELAEMSRIMDARAFHDLCTSPPLQGNHLWLGPPTFLPLDVNTEAPQPGMILAIDAEFVMLSPEEKVIVNGLEGVKTPARLGLARISVLRGDPGPGFGVCCIDDYVRTVEPVYDYLTRFSGLKEGDLDPSTSAHYLTTLKRAYMKLRYLIDAGCVFVGHGLKKDFRMINIDVPPNQVIDTVELFHFKRHRKLGLRFLASYLLGIDIQQETHDSIEDARTALRLYEVYKQLQQSNQFQIKMQEIYQWGKMHGWDPIAI